MRSKKLLKNIGVSLIQNIVAVICGFIVPKLILVTFGSSVNGLVNSITQFLAYITLLESGIGPIIKSKLYKPIAEKNKEEIENILYATQKFFRVIVRIFILYIIILCFIYPLIVNKNFDIMYTVILLIIISFSTIAEYYFGLAYSLFLQADQKTYVTSLFSIITTILNTIGVVILVKIGTNIFLVKLLSSTFLVLRPLLLHYYVKKKYNFDFKNVNKNYKIENKMDGLAQHIASVIHNNTDIAVLTIFSNVLEVSVYSVYLLVVTGVKKFTQSLTKGISASFGNMYVKGEINLLNKNFKIYEFVYFTIITIIFACTAVLIVPFVSIYTKGITDVNYIRAEFSILLVLAEFVNMIRYPYISLTYSVGHFKETMKGAWIEAFSNIIISVILVFKFGLVGVAIGTLFAMTIRAIEFNYHLSKYILKRSVSKSFIKPIVSIIESLIIYFIFSLINIIRVNTYYDWIKYAIIVFIISSIIVILINVCLLNDDFKQSIIKIKEIIKNRKRKVINGKL